MKNQQLKFAVSILVIFVCLYPQVSRAGQQSEPEKEALDVVQSFYRFHLGRDMGFSSRNIRQRSQWFHPSFYELLRYELRRADVFARSHPDVVPHIDGDPFTESQEYPNSFKVESPIIKQNQADVKVKLLWLDTNGKSLDERIMVVKLEKVNGRWLINDFLDPDGKSLRADLSRKKYDTD